jgi:hypothetical protein
LRDSYDTTRGRYLPAPNPSGTFPNQRSRNPSGQSFGPQPPSFLQQQQPLPSFSAAQAVGTIQTTSNSPPILSPPIASPTTQRRRRPPPKPRAPRDEDIIGHVLANKKKFKCVESDCEELTFGRLADLRRHHDQQHARVRHQYYCSYHGCSRSNAVGGGKGRSFGTRKDKRDEHERNVHKKPTDDNRESYSPQSGTF